jgi:hypothetical protein
VRVIGVMCGALLVIGTAKAVPSSVGEAVPSGAARAPSAIGEVPDVLAMDVFVRGAAIDLLLVEATASGKELRHQRSIDGGATWTAAKTVPRHGRGMVGHHRGMDPQVAATGDRVIVLWGLPGSSKWGEGQMATALSTDAGRTWAAGPSPSDDETGLAHAFLDLAVDDAGGVQAVWLDSRDGAQGLRGASSRDGGRRWTRPVSIDTRTCECCWNKTLSTKPGSFLVLYRDKDPRDMGLAISEDDGATWTHRGPVGAFKWGFDGCPHVGGGLSRTVDQGREYLHAVVWTGADAHAGVHVLRSDSGGRSWDAPRKFGALTAKHTDIAGAGATVAVVWDERRGSETAVVSALSRDHGHTWSEPVVVSRPGRTATHPLVVSTTSGLTAFWTERATVSSGPSRWQSARLGEVAWTRRELWQP